MDGEEDLREEGVEVDDQAPSLPDGRSEAEVYVELARAVIGFEFTPDREMTRWDVRTWWRDEAERRKLYRLTKVQEAELMELCRVACEPLPEGAKKPSEWPDESSKPKGSKQKRKRTASAI